MSDSFESGLLTLAEGVTRRVSDAGRRTIAILPFLSTDGTCSELSNYIADELAQSVFSAPGASLRAIDRTQLETLLREAGIATGAVLDPRTLQHLGKASGVAALAVGSYTDLGSHIRLNVRLIATDSAQMFSAVAVTASKAARLSDLMKRPVTTGPLCAPLPSTVPKEDKPLPQAPPQPPTVEAFGLRLQLVNAVADRSVPRLQLSITNAGAQLVSIIPALGSRGTLLTGLSKTYEVYSSTLPSCHDSNCSNRAPSDETILGPKETITIGYQFMATDERDAAAMRTGAVPQLRFWLVKERRMITVSLPSIKFE